MIPVFFFARWFHSYGQLNTTSRKLVYSVILGLHMLRDAIHAISSSPSSVKLGGVLDSKQELNALPSSRWSVSRRSLQFNSIDTDLLLRTVWLRRQNINLDDRRQQRMLTMNANFLAQWINPCIYDHREPRKTAPTSFVAHLRKFGMQCGMHNTKNQRF
jgi:hypothetical protein